MATFNLILDRRTKLKNNQYNLAVRLVNGNDVMYLNVAKMTEQQYEMIFVKKIKDEKSIAFREKCNGYITKCERIFNSLYPFNKEKLRELFFKEENETKIPVTLKLIDLFHYYSKEKKDLKIITRGHYRNTGNIFETYKKGVSVADVTPDFLREFENKKLKEGCTKPSVVSYLINLRSIINYFMHVEKLIPRSYEYPFGKGGYSIKRFTPKKLVMSNEDIQRFIDYDNFESKQEKYARDIWVLLYYCNGINFADLLRMKWENIKGDNFVFYRMKTETTRKSNIKEIVAWISPDVKEILDRVGVKGSPFILGRLKEGYSENMFFNKCTKLKKKINYKLQLIEKKLQLSLPLRLKSARDCYATSLDRAGVQITNISESLGHSNTLVTMHYLGSMNLEDSKKINQHLIYKTR